MLPSKNRGYITTARLIPRADGSLEPALLTQLLHQVLAEPASEQFPEVIVEVDQIGGRHVRGR